MVYLFLANGFEEVEALTPVDVLRRAGVEVRMVSINDTIEVTGRNRIKVLADCTINDIDANNFDMVILPGGQPGTSNLEKCEKVQEILKYAVDNKKWIAAICAAPTILGKKGYLSGREAVCYPGSESDLLGAAIGKTAVVISDNIITSKGAGTALNFAYTLASVLCNEKLVEKLKHDMVYEY